MRRIIPPPSESGAALLTVLLLVAVMGALAAVALERMRLATALAANAVAIDQARHFSRGVEGLMLLAMDDMLAAAPERTTLAGGWQDQVRRIPLPGGGQAEARVRDGGNCFNLNSLASAPGDGGNLASNPIAIAQFTGLMTSLGIPQGSAARIAQSAADWIDLDTAPNREGAEDGRYQQTGHPYRAPNAAMADASEMRAVAGMTPDLYDRVRPFVCALPTHDLSPINVNTLTPGQAPLLAMFAPGNIPIDVAGRVIAERPPAGWSSTADFWTLSGLDGVDVPTDVLAQPQVKTSWFDLTLEIRLADVELGEAALIDARRQPSRIVARRWGIEG